MIIYYILGLLFTMFVIITIWIVRDIKNEWYSEDMYGEDPPGGIGYEEFKRRRKEKKRKS